MAEEKLVKIKLHRSVAGQWKGEGFAYGCGATVDVPAGLAKDLCRNNVNASLVTEKNARTTQARHHKKVTR